MYIYVRNIMAATFNSYSISLYSMGCAFWTQCSNFIQNWFWTVTFKQHLTQCQRSTSVSAQPSYGHTSTLGPMAQQSCTGTWLQLQHELVWCLHLAPLSDLLPSLFAPCSVVNIFLGFWVATTSMSTLENKVFHNYTCNKQFINFSWP